MQLRGQRAELRATGGGPFKVNQRTSSAWLEVDQLSRHVIGEDPNAMDRLDREPGGGEEFMDLVGREATRSPALRTQIRLHPFEQLTSRLELSSHGPGENGRVPLRDENTQHSPRSQNLSDLGQSRSGVDHLQHAVAEDRIGTLRPDDRDQAGEVALLPANHDPTIAGPTSQRCEGIRARVDDGDPMPCLGEPDSRPTGAAADINHIARRSGQGKVEGVPDDGGADGTGGGCGNHAKNTTV